MKRILQVIPSLDLGGTEAFIMNHYRVVNRDEIQFDFLVFAEKDWPYLKEIESLGGRVFFITRPSFRRSIPFYKQFVRIIRTAGPYAAIHCHANEGNAIPLLCGLICGIKNRISHSHCADRVPLRSIRGLIFQLRKIIVRLTATKYLACSDAAGDALYGTSFFKKSGALIKNGIYVNKYCRVDAKRVEALKKELGITSSNKLIFGAISRFDKNKNQLFSVRLFEKVLLKNQNAVLLLGGIDGGELQDIRKYVFNQGLEKHVYFIGKRNDVEVCLKLIDVYLLPSVAEGLPFALLEAQASGCLCYASTGVPAESDMGLGNVFYLDLKDGEEYWAEAICKGIANRVIPTEAQVYEAFSRKGFDVVSSAAELVKYYE